jgi:hypothetical protein
MKVAYRLAWIMAVVFIAGETSLSINDKKVAEGRIKRTVPVVFSTDDTFDVGEDWGTPVSPTYRLPSRFTGALTNVTVEVK